MLWIFILEKMESKLIGLFFEVNRNRPNDTDLEQAVKFAMSFIQK